MRENIDWLSQLLDIITVTGELEIRCAYGAPWRVSYEEAPEREIPFHVVLNGTATFENLGDHSSHPLGPGDIVLITRGSAHVLHDGSGTAPSPAHATQSSNFVISENHGAGERLDMLCGRFVVEAPHDRLIGQYLPGTLAVRSRDHDAAADGASAADQLTGLVHLMRLESLASRHGGFAMLNALSSALFTLTLRVASESLHAPTGLLALAGHRRLSPAISAMLHEPAKPWTLPALAALCNMSRATFMRHFETALGRSATDLLTDIRMSIAANALRNPALGTESVAELVGYQSIAARMSLFLSFKGMVAIDRWRYNRVAFRKNSSMNIGPLALPAGPLVLFIGVAVALLACRFSGERRAEAESAIITATLIGLCVGRLVFVLQYLPSYRGNVLHMLDIRDEGFVAIPGIAAGIVVILFIAIRRTAIRRPVAVAATLGLIAWSAGGAIADRSGDPMRVPSIAVYDEAGTPQYLARHNGKPLVVNLWATWCGPCRAEMPVLAQAQANHTELDLVFVNQGESHETVNGFLTGLGVQIGNSRFDPQLTLAKSTQVTAYPTTLFYDAEGRLLEKHLGRFSEATFEAALARLYPGQPAVTP